MKDTMREQIDLLCFFYIILDINVALEIYMPYFTDNSPVQVIQ